MHGICEISDKAIIQFLGGHHGFIPLSHTAPSRLTFDPPGHVYGPAQDQPGHRSRPAHSSEGKEGLLTSSRVEQSVEERYGGQNNNSRISQLADGP